MTASNPPPGWYPDPAGGGVRFWDGRAWTQHASPSAESRPDPGLGPQRPPSSVGLVVALAVVGVLVAFVGWQVLGASRPSPPPRPPRPAPLTIAPATPGPSAPAPATLPPAAPTPPPPSLTMDPGCPETTDALATTGATAPLLPRWVPDEPYLSFDCPVTALTTSAHGYAEFSLAVVDPAWGLSDDEVLDWVWDDLNLSTGDSRPTPGRVGGRPALGDSRTVEESGDGHRFDTTFNIAVVDAGGDRRVVVVSAVGRREGVADPRLFAEVQELWDALQVTG